MPRPQASPTPAGAAAVDMWTSRRPVDNVGTRCPPPVALPTCPQRKSQQPFLTEEETNTEQPNTLGQIYNRSTQRTAPDQAAPGSYLNWKGLGFRTMFCWSLSGSRGVASTERRVPNDESGRWAMLGLSASLPSLDLDVVACACRANPRAPEMRRLLQLVRVPKRRCRLAS